MSHSCYKCVAPLCFCVHGATLCFCVHGAPRTKESHELTRRYAILLSPPPKYKATHSEKRICLQPTTATQHSSLLP